jgi:hypothetical protein
MLRGEEECVMTKRRTIASAPEPLEAYASHFDDLFGKSNQREAFRWYLEGLLLPSERNKTLTGLVNTEPLVGAQLPRAQKVQWFLSESNWEERQVQAKRLKLLRETPATAPTTQGTLVIDETGDRKDGHKTAHVARQYLGNVGKIENGVVSVSSLWADEDVYYPLDVEPYTRGVLFCRRQERFGVSNQAADRFATGSTSERARLAVSSRGGGFTLRRRSRLENGAAPIAGPLCAGPQSCA